MAVVTSRGADRIRAGHPWIYQSDVVSADAEPGDLVRVVSERSRRIGWAFWSSASQIALRLVSTGDVADERALFLGRLREAIAYRASLKLALVQMT
jgi:23S rRNA (cytosine1962-C5)-methyltransferase